MTLKLSAESIFNTRNKNVFNRIRHVDLLCYSNYVIAILKEITMGFQKESHQIDKLIF